MKISKTVTDALAIMLALFIFIYILTGYINFDPTEKALEESSKLTLFLDQNESSAELLHLAILLFVSGLLGMALKRIPELTVVTSLLALSFAMTLDKFSMITKHPLVITILCAAHFFGAIVYCAYLDRNPTKVSGHSLRAAVGSAACALGTTGYLLVKQNCLREVIDYINAIEKAEITLNNKVKFNTDYVQLIGMKLENYGADEAAELASSFGVGVDYSSLKMKILSEITAEQFKTYLRLGIILLAAVVFYIVLRRYFKALSFVPALIPAVYVIFEVHADNMAAMSLPLMVMTVSFFVCAFAGFDQSGKGHDTAYDPDPEEIDKPDDDSDEITYT